MQRGAICTACVHLEAHVISRCRCLGTKSMPVTARARRNFFTLLVPVTGSRMKGVEAVKDSSANDSFLGSV